MQGELPEITMFMSHSGLCRKMAEKVGWANSCGLQNSFFQQAASSPDLILDLTGDLSTLHV
jgi:hypothetical protein